MGAGAPPTTGPTRNTSALDPHRWRDRSSRTTWISALQLGTDDTVFIPSVLILATYLLGTAAAVRLFTGNLRLLASTAIARLLLTVPFAGWHLLLPPAVAAAVHALHRIQRTPTPPMITHRPVAPAATLA